MTAAGLTGSGMAVKTHAGRLDAVDLARGTAVVLMIAYHFCWNLLWLGLVDWPLLTHPLWLAARTLIVCLFLGLVGVSLVLATRSGLSPRPFARRLAVIVGAAGLITLATALAIPQSFIFFGILHHIAVASLLGLLFLRLPPALTALAALACIAAPAWLAAPLFDAPALQWLGLMTYAPQSNDYVPIFPWFAAVLAGIAFARIGLGERPGSPRLARWSVRWQAAGPLLWLGRNSLIVYLLHQPLLIGALLAGLAVTDSAALERTGLFVDQPDGFLEECVAACRHESDEATCARYCGCVQMRLAAQGIPTSRENDPATMTDVTRAAIIDAMQGCLAEHTAP